MNGVVSSENIITIQSRDFGEVKVSADEIITFPNGLFAFEDLTEYVLISPLGDNEYPMWLQSTQSTKPCFIVFDSAALVPGYNPSLTNNECEMLKIEENTAIKYLVIAVVHEDHLKTTVNLKCPIVINTERRIAAQVILTEDYSFRQPIFETEKGA